MKKTDTKELREPHAYITFDDVIALALANTQATKFTADSQSWQKVLYEIREKYQDKIPELKMMYFDESRSDIPPQSEEFYQLINILSASKLISLPNPTFEHILMDDPRKERAKNLEERLLQRYKDHIAGIAGMLEGELAVQGQLLPSSGQRTGICGIKGSNKCLGRLCFTRGLFGESADAQGY